MPARICPTCRADLEDDLVASTGSAVCPFCGADVSAMYAETPGTDAEWSLDSSTTADNRIGALDERPPRDSKIEVVESSSERFVVVVPPGGKSAAGIGCFAVAWNGFMTVFTSFLVAATVGGQDDVPVFAYLLVGLFWIIGLGFAYAWVRASYMKTFLLLERDRLAVQRVLFGTKWVRKTKLTAESRARLESSYSENDNPVYHVQVDGDGRSESFGLRLGDDEKEWFVRRINGFLHGPEEAVVHGGRQALRRVEKQEITHGVEPLAPFSLPTGSVVRIDDRFVDGLRFSLPLLHGGMFSGCSWGCGGVGLVWVTFCSLVAFVAADWPSRLVPVFMAFPGTLFLLASLAFRWGRIQVTVDGEALRARWHSGPVGWSKSLPVESIRAVGLGEVMVTKSNGRTTNSVVGCLVKTENESLPLTVNHGEEIAREVAGLVRYELERRRVVLEEVGGV